MSCRGGRGSDAFQAEKEEENLGNVAIDLLIFITTFT